MVLGDSDHTVLGFSCGKLRVPGENDTILFTGKADELSEVFTLIIDRIIAQQSQSLRQFTKHPINQEPHNDEFFTAEVQRKQRKPRIKKWTVSELSPVFAVNGSSIITYIFQ
jgi:hypothetical protein